ncbi:histone deacetylase 6 isoform X3 [Atheta coriaria]
MRNLKMAKEAQETMNHSDWVQDEYAESFKSALLVRGRTGIAFNDDMIMHKCEWDSGYPENPARYVAIMHRLNELGLVNRCVRIQNEHIDIDDITKLHQRTQYENLYKICEPFNVNQAEKIASNYDAIYFNKDTFHCANVAAATTLGLVRAVAEGRVSNGLAVVRPPGHHAQQDIYNGYCFFNNVAIAAAAVQSLAQKILIVDFDVHHGQGVQDMFYNNNNVLYFSIHRYEHGEFWPNLRRSNFDHVGSGAGEGFNINFPLNTIGCTDTDYMAIVTQILLPVAYEFQPDLILFCAGYDACVGCPEGCMKVTPGFYGHLIKLLSGLAYGKLAVVLEGGYFLPSLAEGVAMTLRALLDDAPAFLLPMKDGPNDEVISTINDVKSVLCKYWKCFKVFENIGIKYANEEKHIVNVQYKGFEDSPPYPTRNCYPVVSQQEQDDLKVLVDCLKVDYGLPMKNKLCYVFDAVMLTHEAPEETVENPLRLQALYDRFLELELDKRCKQLEIKRVDFRALSIEVHSKEYLDDLINDGPSIPPTTHDLFWNSGSKISIETAVSGLITVCDAVMSGEYTSGVALIRPPGHHAEQSKTSGFCFVNNVAVAAKYMLDNGLAERILILDFDIHHGNGTQDIFYNSDKVMFISIHKFESGTYFPRSSNGSFDKVGAGVGAGFNVNVPFEINKMGCVDYLTAFFKIVLPCAYAFGPDVVLVSAGFDAGINDLLGNYKVMPQTFGHMIQLLRPLAGGRLIVALEGGYNINTLKHSMVFCIKTLLGDPLPPPSDMSRQKDNAHRTFTDVIYTLKKYWKFFNFEKRLLPE